MFLPLVGEPSLLRVGLEGDPARWLPDAQPTVDGRWSTVLHGAGWSHRVAVRVGTPWESTTTLWRTVSWEPLRPDVAPDDRPVRHLPTFDGELGLFASGDIASLAIEGRYRAPGGPLGAVLDGLALHRVARSTANRLLEDIAVLLRAAAEQEHTGSSPPAVR
jgi:hypothetical protein